MTSKPTRLFSQLLIPLSCLLCSSAWCQTPGFDELKSSSYAPSAHVTGKNLAVADSPFHHFDSACEHCVQLDHQRVARDIRKGVKFLSSETKYAKVKGKKALQGSVTELNKIATGIENGTVYSAKQLKESFARAQHALASHHHQVAEEARKQNRLEDAGKALKLAAVNLEQGVAWTGENLVVKPGAKILDSSIKVTGVLVDGTIDGTSRSVKAVGSGIGQLGHSIQRFGKAIKSSTIR